MPKITNRKRKGLFSLMSWVLGCRSNPIRKTFIEDRKKKLKRKQMCICHLREGRENPACLSVPEVKCFHSSPASLVEKRHIIHFGHRGSLLTTCILQLLSITSGLFACFSTPFLTPSFLFCFCVLLLTPFFSNIEKAIFQNFGISCIFPFHISVFLV